jgi:class 3 adenylate cyclase
LKNFEKIRDRYTKYWLGHHGKKIDVDLKCGMHLGYVLFGLLETERRKQITVIGRTVNLASRLVEEIAIKDEIVVSEELMNVTQNRFEFEPKDVKNKIKSFEDINTIFMLVRKKILP